MAFYKNKNIIFGEPEPPKFLTNERSLGEFLLNSLTTLGNKIILVNGITGESLTAIELRKEGIRLAKCLQSFGVKVGDKIGICSENRDEFVFLILSNILLGTTLAPINSTYSERELIHALDMSKPKIIFSSFHAIDKVVRVSRNLKYVQQIVVFGHETYYSDVPTYLKFINSLKIETNTEFICKPTNMDENILFIHCSSGTTGLPKGVQISQNNMLLGAELHCGRKKDDEIQLCPSVRILCVSPFFHAYGLGLVFCSLCKGDMIVYLPKFEDKLFLRAIEAFKVNTIYLVPPLVVFLARNKLVDEYNLSSLKVIFSSSAPLSKELIDAVQQRIGFPLIRQSYGMTETSFTVAIQNQARNKIGSVGVLCGGLSGKIIDIESGKILDKNELGEICITGGTIMKGYVNNEEATRNIIDNEGWLHTGDIGYYDEDGEWFVVDRLKELIKYKGFQVPPAEIEALLLTHPAIQDAAVIGKLDENAGELPLAFIVKKDGENVSDSEIVDFVAARSSPPKRLHGGVIFIGDIPKNPSGKILRRVLRDFIKNE